MHVAKYIDLSYICKINIIKIFIFVNYIYVNKRVFAFFFNSILQKSKMDIFFMSFFEFSDFNL